MANEEMVAFLALDLTEKIVSAGPSPLWSSFRDDKMLYVHDEICGMAVCFFDPALNSSVYWNIKIVSNPSPVGPHLSLLEALQDLKEVSKGKILVVPDSRELLFLQIALIRWHVKLCHKEYLDFLSYARGVLDAQKFSPAEFHINIITQEIQKRRDLRARLDYCVETYHALQKLLHETKPAEKDSDRWPGPGCCDFVGC